MERARHRRDLNPDPSPARIVKGVWVCKEGPVGAGPFRLFRPFRSGRHRGSWSRHPEAGTFKRNRVADQLSQGYLLGRCHIQEPGPFLRCGPHSYLHESRLGWFHGSTFAYAVTLPMAAKIARAGGYLGPLLRPGSSHTAVFG